MTAGAAAEVELDEVEVEVDGASTTGELTATTGGTETAKIPPGW